MYSQMLGGKYIANCPVIHGKYSQFSQYISNYAKTANGHGVDIGAGPEGLSAKFFSQCKQLDGCDLQPQVIDSLPKDLYSKTFKFDLANDSLPYSEQQLDFVVCSCVIHHLNSHQQLVKGIKQMCRVLKNGGTIFLIYKAGVHDTLLKHFHRTMNIYRQVRVFDRKQTIQILEKQGMQIIQQQILGDFNWVPYICLIAKKT